MRIILSPQRSDAELVVVKAGDVLTVNGEAFDFSPATEGSTLPRSAISGDWFVGNVDRQDGQLIITLRLPIPSNVSPDQPVPADLIDVPDGPVAFPAPLPMQVSEIEPEVEA
jgi:hypothetical protein